MRNTDIDPGRLTSWGMATTLSADIIETAASVLDSACSRKSKKLDPS